MKRLNEGNSARGSRKVSALFRSGTLLSVLTLALGFAVVFGVFMIVATPKRHDLKAGDIADATITATNEEGVFGTIEVTVSEKTRPSSITVTSSKTEISTGEKVSLSVAFDPADCDDKDITYTSSDDTIATVNNKGEVTGLAAGEVDITVSLTSDPTISGTIHITVSGEAAVIDADYCGTYSG